MRRFLWNWGVVGALLLFLLGCGVSFMTSGHAFVADGFYIASAVLFIFKFLTWEEAKSAPNKVIAYGLLITLLVLVVAIGGNHLMNASTDKPAARNSPPKEQAVEIRHPVTKEELADVLTRLKPPDSVGVSKTGFNIDVPTRYITADLKCDCVRFWLITHRPSGYVRSASQAALFVRLTNKQDARDRIDGLDVEVKEMGKWEECLRLDTAYGGMFAMNELGGSKRGTVLTDDADLAAKLVHGVIEPLGSLDGWIIVRYPKGYAPSDGLGTMRLSVHAVRAGWFSKDINPDAHPSNLLQANWKVKNVIDISAVPIE